MQTSPNVVNGVYKNAEHGLQVKLAPRWGDGESSLPGSIALFYPPDDKPGTLNLFYRDAAGKDADAVIADLQKEIGDHDANAKIEPTNDAKLGGKPARTFTYRSKRADGERSGLMLVGVHEGKAYVFMYSAPPAEYDTDIAAVKRMIDSLRWTAQGNKPVPRAAR